jgi:hypothetical protein
MVTPKAKSKPLGGDMSRKLIAAFKAYCLAIRRKPAHEATAAVFAWTESSFENQSQSIIDSIAVAGALEYYSAQVRLDINDRFRKRLWETGYVLRAGFGGVLQYWLKLDEETRNKYRALAAQEPNPLLPPQGVPHV